jgi:hypothetical protein
LRRLETGESGRLAVLHRRKKATNARSRRFNVPRQSVTPHATTSGRTSTSPVRVLHWSKKPTDRRSHCQAPILSSRAALKSSRWYSSCRTSKRVCLTVGCRR